MNQISQNIRPGNPSGSGQRKSIFRYARLLRLRPQLALLLVTLLPIFSSSPVQALEPVSGRYLISYGTIVSLEVRVLFPPPASLIVELYFPPGLEIVNGTPIPQKYSSKRGKSKWFFKGVQVGSSIISLQFDRPVQSSEMQAVLRYRYPGRGYFVETTITP